MTAERELLRVEDVVIAFPDEFGRRVRVIDGVSFSMGRPETLGLVGESGSGKTVTALSVIGLSDPAARVEGGHVWFDGVDLLTLSQEELREYRGRRITMIFQSPKTGLNPLIKAGDQVARVLRLHRGLGKEAARREAVALLHSVGIADADRRYHSYPHQLSGGMAQRVMIAMTLAAEPELLIADEPTTGLDVTIQAQIFDLLREVQQRLGMSVLLITHDLGVVAETCDRVAVMHAGHVVETGSVEAVFDHPRHPYTERLLKSVLQAGKRVRVEEPLVQVSEAVTYAARGCRYAPKCPRVFEPCQDVRPTHLTVGPGHRAMCHLYDPAYERVAERTAAEG